MTNGRQKRTIIQIRRKNICLRLAKSIARRLTFDPISSNKDVGLRESGVRGNHLRSEGKIIIPINLIGPVVRSSDHVHDAARHHDDLSNGLAIELGQGAFVFADDFFYVCGRHRGGQWQLESHLAVE